MYLLLGEEGTPTPAPTPTPAADAVPDCIEKIDAALHWDYSSTKEYVYVFAGDWYYRWVKTTKFLFCSFMIFISFVSEFSSRFHNSLIVR